MEITGQRSGKRKMEPFGYLLRPGYRPAIYLNAKKMMQGGRGQMGYATKFDHYHFAAVHGKGKYGDYFDGKSMTSNCTTDLLKKRKSRD